MRCWAETRTSSVDTAVEAALPTSSTDEYLIRNPPKPIYINDLCQILGVSYRKLYEAFILTRGESPSLYLKRRRLMLAHQVLSNAGSEAPLVKTVALDHGFWHFGNFSQDYRNLFGETPSETLVLARSRTNMLPRDDQQRPEGAASGPAATLRRRRGPIHTRHGAAAASSHGDADSVPTGRRATNSAPAASHRA